MALAEWKPLNSMIPILRRAWHYPSRWLFIFMSFTDLKRGRIKVDGTLSDTTTLSNDLPEGSQHDNRVIAFDLIISFILM